jgi:hypothetical protein
MKRLAVLAVVACLCGCALAGTGRADTIYDATGTFNDGAVLSGTVTFNDTGGLVAASLQVTLAGMVVVDTSMGQPTVGLSQLIGFDGKTYDNLEGGDFLDQASLDLIFLASSIPGSSSVTIQPTAPVGPFGSESSSYLPANGDFPIFFSTGELTPEAPTSAPEPASLTLLGIGAVGLLGYRWRRRRRAAA